MIRLQSRNAVSHNLAIISEAELRGKPMIERIIWAVVALSFLAILTHDFIGSAFR